MTKRSGFRVLYLLPLLTGFAACGGLAEMDSDGSMSEWGPAVAAEDVATENLDTMEASDSEEPDTQPPALELGTARQALGDSACTSNLRRVDGGLASWGFNFSAQDHSEVVPKTFHKCTPRTRFHHVALQGDNCNYTKNVTDDLNECGITIHQHSNGGSGGQCDWAICSEPFPHGTINVVSATYGQNCGAPVGNQTAELAKQCNARTGCVYVVDFQRIGDPAPGCAKSYNVQYECMGSEGVPRFASAAPEAGFGSVIALRCEPNL
jgi:hypothetical protein